LKYAGNRLTEIKISTEASPQFFILSVSDDGIGIKQEDAKRIFRPFERNDSSRSVQGSGLGLAIVKQIAEQHKGEVWVKPGRKGGMSVCLSIAKNL
jgi:signal transduction histidine kinase